MIPLLYQDDDLFVVNKPAGIAMHQNEWELHREATLTHLLKKQLGVKTLFPAHRLDRSVSGLLLFAKHKAAAKLIHAQFLNNHIQKHYLAIVRGFAPSEGVIDRPLTGESRKPPAKPAVTHFQTLAQIALPHPINRYPETRYSLVQAQPRTGRYHQLRRHLAGINHPILGDRKHGDRDHNHFLETEFGIRRVMLHAEQLAFPHPYTEESLHLTGDLPADMKAVMNAFGWMSERKTSKD